MTEADHKRGCSSHSFAFWIAGLELSACVAAFSLAVWSYGRFIQGNPSGSWPPHSIHEVVISALTAWIATTPATANPWGDPIRLWTDRFFSAAGYNLVVQYGLGYLFHIQPTPWPAVVAGSALAISLIALFQRRVLRAIPDSSNGTLVLGYDTVAESILPSLGGRVAGVLSAGDEHAFSFGPPSGPTPIVGDLSCFDDVMASGKPGRILVNDTGWPSAILPRRLLALRHAGVVVEDAPALFEQIQKRVCWQRLDPLDLMLSLRLSMNRSAVALQAIYTNVIGLALLVLLSPVLVLAAVLVTLTNPGPPIEGMECPGFQRIPFRAFRFRTRRRNGSPAWSGKFLTALHLIGLPQLINVVRGEMALFGPPPVRKEFAGRLAQLIPVYAHRFSVKPGIMGWSQANLAAVRPAPDESLRLEYDLYYVREESPSLDLDILLRTAFRAAFHPASRLP